MNDVIYYAASLINTYIVQYFARCDYSSHGECIVLHLYFQSSSVQIVQKCEFLHFAYFHVLMLQSAMNKQEIV